MINNSFTEECETFLNQAEKLHSEWLQQNPTLHAKLDSECLYPSPYRPPQPNWGHTGNNTSLPSVSLPSRWNNKKDIDACCPRCKSTNYFVSKSFVEGCRMNGDGYGNNYSMCPNCGWVLWSAHDEAD